MRKLRTKAQMKILESIAVLVVFFFLVAIGIKFYGNIQLKNLEEAKLEFARNDAIKISQKVSHMPELRCTLETTDQGSCIDLYQAKSWESVNNTDECVLNLSAYVASGLDSTLCSNRQNHYFEQIGVGEIILRRIYSADLTVPPAVWVLYNYTSNDEDLRVTSTQIPVVIRDSVAGRNDFGILQVRVSQ